MIYVLEYYFPFQLPLGDVLLLVHGKYAIFLIVFQPFRVTFSGADVTLWRLLNARWKTVGNVTTLTFCCTPQHRPFCIVGVGLATIQCIPTGAKLFQGKQISRGVESFSLPTVFSPFFRPHKMNLLGFKGGTWSVSNGPNRGLYRGSCIRRGHRLIWMQIQLKLLEDFNGPTGWVPQRWAPQWGCAHSRQRPQFHGVRQNRSPL